MEARLFYTPTTEACPATVRTAEGHKHSAFQGLAAVISESGRVKVIIVFFIVA